MDDVKLYSTHCPKCKILESKLKNKNIEYTEITDVDEMQKLGIVSVPYLSVNGNLLNFGESIKWVNGKE